MKEIRILHLYRNLMNLYGEHANVAVLKAHLKDQGIIATIHGYNSVETIPNLSAFDFIYMGAGTEKNQKIAIDDLMTKRDEFVTACENGAIALFTGCAMELLGQSITDAQGEVTTALGIANFTTTQQNAKRLNCDCLFNSELLNCQAVGFINRSSIIEGDEDRALFDVIIGHGNHPETTKEGFTYKNVFATHLTGPSLVKNPEFMNCIVSLIGKKASNNFEFKEMDYPYEVDAHNYIIDKLLNKDEPKEEPLEENTTNDNIEQESYDE